MVKVVKTRVEVEGVWREEYAILEEDRLESWGPGTKLSIIGKSTPRVDGPARVSGAAKYTHDIQLPGMLYAKILRSPQAHARIKRIDTSKAELLPGVRGVLTYRNSPKIVWKGESEALLFDETLRYHGDNVAAVAADEEEIAEDAVSLIDVEYEPLPFVIDPVDGAQENAPKVTDDGNVEGGQPRIYERGNIGRGFKESEVTVEGTYRTPTQLHNALETHSSVVSWENDQLTVWDSTQHIFGVREQLASALKIPLQNVRVIKDYMGGGFGAKNNLGKYTLIAAVLSRMTNRPVRVALSREEENLAAGNRSATVQHLKLGAIGDGTLKAIQLVVYSQIGAFGWGAGVDGPAKMLYKCENVRTEKYAVYTNTAPNTAFRAPGHVEGTFALESAMDELAQKLGMDPLELRNRNYADLDQVENIPYTSKGLRETYKVGAEKIEWSARDKLPQLGTKRRGIGMASQIWWGGGGPPAYAVVKISHDGKASVITGTQDIGTGTRTILCQIAAEELGYNLHDVQVSLGDTHFGVYSPLSAGSGTLASVGPAVRAAAADAKRQLLDLASQILELPADSLSITRSQILHEKSAEPKAPVADIIGKFENFMIIGRGSRGPNPDNANVNTFGSQFAEVDVDIETGEVTVLRIVAVHESGRVINPLTIRSQIEGGVIQGLGFALMEQRIIDRNTGLVVNANLEDYKIPTMTDIPTIEAIALDLPDPACNSLGAKGIGEPPIIPAAAAVSNAIAHAIGKRIYQLPITRERVLRALHGE